jgi:glycosyltransferase involved in cell wall biosynthesis
LENIMGEWRNGERSEVDASVIIANYNGENYIADAIRSACNQSLRSIEIIVSDDASTDSSVRIVESFIAEDNRIRLIPWRINGGPAAARNRALDVAKGQWICILDSDDLMHPDRIRSLIEVAAKTDADIVADDVLFFDDGRRQKPKTLLSGSWARSAHWVSAKDYLQTSNFYGRGPSLGYLKPIFRASVIAKREIRYDERLTIAEDFNFVFRLLMAEAKFRIVPQIGYFYRRHGASISHRLNSDVLQRVLDVESGWRERWPLASLQLKSRERSVTRAIAFDRLVLAIKSKKILSAAVIAIANPAAACLLVLPIGQFLKRLCSKPKSLNRKQRQLCILTRQRVIGRTNGSSRYLLDIAAFLARRGFDVHLVVPSPSTMGRWPFLKLSDDMAIFESIRFRGAMRIGRYVVAYDPRLILKGTLGLLDRFLYHRGLITYPLTKPAPYAIAQPLTRRDQLFIAREAPPIADALIADYCFLTGAFPYALRPDARRIVIMHDLFSSRPSQFQNLHAADSVTSLCLAEETKMLAAADTIVAIQKDEADVLRRRLPNHEILVAPIAAIPVEGPQVGTAEIVLFVGSSAAPNIDGIKWFIESCWPEIQRSRPNASLYIVGSVCDALGHAPAAIKLLNVVESLEDLYAMASVVISPLRAGSGLKIKLIEALSKGKAVVATSTTLQGVADMLSGCVRVADTAPSFASMVTDLLADESSRAELGANGISAVSQHFAPESAYGAIVAAVERTGSGTVARSCVS